MDTLNKYKDKSLYEVPDHFFEKFQHDVMQCVRMEEKQQKRYKQWLSSISVAASIAIIIALSYFIFLNRNPIELFYAHEDMLLQEDSASSLYPNHLAEANERIDTATEKIFYTEEPKTGIKEQLVVETIAYLAVDFYLDDFETENFYDTMYELECYYNY